MWFRRVAYGKRQDPSRHWSEALPQRAFWANAAGLVLDGVRFSTGKTVTIEGGGYTPVPRVERGAPPPPPPPRSSPPRPQTDEERWEVEGARRRNKDMKKKGSGGEDAVGGKGEGKNEKKEKQEKKEKKEKKEKSAKGARSLPCL